jgi:hypothetical protein
MQLVVLTITDDDNPPALSIDDVITADESAANAEFTVSLSAASGKDITVDYATSNGTATTADGDYTATSGTLTISAGATSGTFNVPVLADTTDENNETVTLTLSNPSNATISDATGVLTITDDDNPPALSVNDISADEDGTSGTFTVSLSAVSGKDISVNYTTSNGTATAGSDYTATSGTLTISAGNSSGSISVLITNDSTFEGDETVTLTLLDPATNATISDDTGILTIAEDDPGPTLSINDVTTADESAANATFTITLTPASGLTALVDYATSNGTATAGSDYVASSGTILFGVGETSKTFTVPVLSDTTDENNETVTLTLSNAVRATIGDNTGILTITDDDNPPALSIDDISEDEDGTSGTFTVSLSAASGKDITVDYATSNTTATAGSDYTATSGTLTISAGVLSDTLEIPITDDSIYEGDETVTLTLSNPSNATISDGTGILTITENESAPVVTLATSASTIAEDAGSSLTLTATISQEADENVVVTLATAGTSTNGDDYSSLSTITVLAGQLTGTADFTPTDDSTYEGNETAIISIDSVSGADATESGTQSVTITVTEDESTPVVTLATSNTSIAEDAGSSLTLTATLSVATTEDVTVALGTAGTGTEGTDYGVISDITVLAGETTGTADFTPTDDSTYEGDETAVVSITSVSGGSANESGTPQEVTITISENESAPVVTLATSASTIAEDAGSSLTLTATISQEADENVVVTLATAGTSTNGDRLSVVYQPLQFLQDNYRYRRLYTNR